MGSSQPSSQEHDAAVDLAQRGAVLAEGYALKLTTGKFGQLVTRRVFNKSPQRRFLQLHRHCLYYWRNEAHSRTRAPQSFVFPRLLHAHPSRARLAGLRGGDGAAHGALAL